MERFNQRVADAAAELGLDHPVTALRLVHIDRVHANDYNPNSVAGPEMNLLHTSITADGYTQPVVATHNPETGQYTIVDGFHRYAVMRTQRDVHDTTGGYLPVVVLDKPDADRMASTVRHNRARGKHSVAGMSNLVFQMLTEGEADETICNKLGLEAEELTRLKYITGFAKLFEDHEYSRARLSDREMRVRQRYAAQHPDETLPTDW